MLVSINLTEGVKMKDMIIEDQQIPGHDRHNFILNIFDSLEAGDSITIVSKCDPKPLWTQLNEQQMFQFSLEYLVNGPNEWKVKLTKKMKENWVPLH